VPPDYTLTWIPRDTGTKNAIIAHWHKVIEDQFPDGVIQMNRASIILLTCLVAGLDFSGFVRADGGRETESRKGVGNITERLTTRRCAVVR
jgi:hypothetical protein